MLLNEDKKGLFVRATSIVKDARAPCFSHDEKFYSCPVAMATTCSFTHAAYGWHARVKDGLLDTLAPTDKLPALVLAAISEVGRAISARERWDHDVLMRKMDK